MEAELCYDCSQPAVLALPRERAQSLHHLLGPLLPTTPGDDGKGRPVLFSSKGSANWIIFINQGLLMRKTKIPPNPVQLCGGKLQDPILGSKVILGHKTQVVLLEVMQK